MIDLTYYWKKIVSQIRNIEGGQEPEPSLVPVPKRPPELYEWGKLDKHCKGQLLVVGRDC